MKKLTSVPNLSILSQKLANPLPNDALHFLIGILFGIQNWKFVKPCGEQHNLDLGGAVVVALYKLYHQPPLQKMGSIEDSAK